MPPIFNQSAGNPDISQDPFAQMGDFIEHQRIIRENEIAQYEQQRFLPATMTLSQQRMVATGGRFQYGVPGGQPSARSYQRSSQLSRQVFTGEVGKAALEWGAWGALGGVSAAAGSGLASAAGFGAVAGAAGMAASFALPMLAAAPLAWGMNKELNRQKFAGAISTDIESYMQRSGNQRFTFQQATGLGNRIQSSMYAPGQFFSRDKQMEIHKTALASGVMDMTTAGKTMGTKGSIEGYKRDFDELMETTKDVVKLLNTTVEGGLSVLKELKGAGFRTLKDARAQIIQAKAYGNVAGIGTQNMMQVGAAGAQAVQGTGIASMTGANMYQTAVGMTGAMAQADPTMAAAVRRAGGVAQAGAGIARAQLNVMQSGMGTYATAAIMKGKGGIDQTQLNRLMSGQMGADEIYNRAQNTGDRLGQGGRAAYMMYQEDVINKLSPIQMTMINRGMFNQWRKQAGPGVDPMEAAWVYAGTRTDNPAERRTFARSLTQPIGGALTTMYAENQINKQSTQQVYPDSYRHPINRMVTKGMRGINDFFTDVGRDLTETAQGVIGRGMTGVNKAWTGLGNLIDPNYWGGYGGRPTAQFADRQEALRDMYGARKITDYQRESLAGRGAFVKGAARSISQAYGVGVGAGNRAEEIAVLKQLGIDPGKLGNLSSNDAAMVMQQFSGMLTSSGDVSNITKLGGEENRLLGLRLSAKNRQILKDKGAVAVSAIMHAVSDPINREMKAIETYDRNYSSYLKNNVATAGDIRKSVLGISAMADTRMLRDGVKGAKPADIRKTLEGIGEYRSLNKAVQDEIYGSIYRSRTGDASIDAARIVGRVSGAGKGYQETIDEITKESRLETGRAFDSSVGRGAGATEYAQARRMRAKSKGMASLDKAFGGDRTETLKFMALNQVMNAGSIEDLEKTIRDPIQLRIAKKMFNDRINLAETHRAGLRTLVETGAAGTFTEADSLVKSLSIGRTGKGYEIAALETEIAREKGREIISNRVDTFVDVMQKKVGLKFGENEINLLKSARLGGTLITKGVDVKAFSKKLGITGNLTADKISESLGYIQGAIKDDEFEKKKQQVVQTAKALISEKVRETMVDDKAVIEHLIGIDKGKEIYGTETDKREAKKANKEKLDTITSLTLLDDKKRGVGDSALTASVSPPVLNYWNNKWVL